MRTLFCTLLLAMLYTAGQAQQLQTSSLYDLQGVFHNPATAGTSPYDIAGATYRSQWSGLSGSPRTATAFASFNLPNQGMGLGGYLYSDRTGPTSRTGLQLAGAKHIALAGGRLSFGIEARLQQYAINRGKLSESLGSDPVLAGSDNRMQFDAGLGVTFTNDRLQVGASVSQLVQSKLNFYNGNLGRSEEARLYRHYYLHGRYTWNTDGTTKIIPHFLLIYLPNAPTELQGGVRVEHNNLLWWGVGGRARQSFTLSAGVHIRKQFSVGYAFDVYRTPLSIFDGGHSAHEVLLRYNFVK